MNTTKRFMKKIAMAGILLAVPGIIMAHDMWIAADDFFIAKGNIVSMKMISDHTFPPQHNEFVAQDKLTKSYVLSPAGKYYCSVKRYSQDVYQTAAKLFARGSYLLVSGKKFMYWTQTTRGWKEGKNKKQVEGAVKGVYSGKFSKAIVYVGGPGGTGFSRKVGHDLEIIPLVDPMKVGKKGKLPVKILFLNRPIAATVKATYAGFSTKDNEFAHTLKSNTSGLVYVPLAKKGKWIITTEVRKPYANKQLADEKMYASTLTFEIR